MLDSHQCLCVGTHLVAGVVAAVAVYEYDYQYDGGLLLAAGGRRGAAANSNAAAADRRHSQQSHISLNKCFAIYLPKKHQTASA